MVVVSGQSAMSGGLSQSSQSWRSIDVGGVPPALAPAPPPVALPAMPPASTLPPLPPDPPLPPVPQPQSQGDHVPLDWQIWVPSHELGPEQCCIAPGVQATDPSLPFAVA